MCTYITCVYVHDSPVAVMAVLLTCIVMFLSAGLSRTNKNLAGP